MKQIDHKIRRLMEEKYGDEIRKVKRKYTTIEQENNNLKKENRQYKEGIEKINAIPNLQPDVKKIINSLLVK